MVETEDNQFIVAIGASAGGLEALSLFFDHTPVDGVSYVIIQHLSPDFKSRMSEILAHHSLLEIMEATEGMPVDTNKVYLIPNTKYMGIKSGRLFLIDKQDHQTPHMTVDAFFTSLAEERGHKAVGVILSGVGTDGSRGCCAIQDAGGLILVQEPSSAKFDGMPKASIAMCNPNFILPAEAIPLTIEHYVHNQIQVKAVVINEITTKAIVNLIKEQFPYDFTDYKIPTLVRRINRRMVHHNLEEENIYFDFLKNNPDEIEILISDFLIGVTSFFRDPEAFQIIEDDVIPQLIDQKAPNSLLKIWVAGCATGEEAYSLAILVKEYLDKSGKKIDVKIFASDINRVALDHASKGVYLDNIGIFVSRERLMRYFDKGEDYYKIKPEIRNMLIFARHDLAKNPPYCYVDLISCRNMLIYIKPVLQKQILAKLTFGLQKNGYLFLGSSESLSVAKDEFLEISAKWKIYQTVQTSQTARPKGILSAAISGISLNNVVDIPAIPKVIAEDPALTHDLTEVVLEENGFCGVSIDQDGKVLQTFGNIARYLKPERFNFNLQELLPEPLAVAFSAALHDALKQNKRVRINKIHFNSLGSYAGEQTDIIITPYLDRKGKRKGMLVLFKEAENIAPGRDEGVDFNMDTHVKQHIFNLEEELLQTRHDLQSANEFLESSKEAMQSFNEELLSANEELQSANEELQSINEELETINSEHKSTILEISELNDDLNNYFNSNINGQLFVDCDILLKKFSPGTVKHINLKPRDIGRPLSNITTNIRFETLINDIRKVISDGEVIVKEIQSNEDKIYQVTTSPYIRRNQATPNGAIITFYDITDLKRVLRELDSSNKMLLAATSAAGMGTWSMNLESREFIPSPRMKEIFGFEQGEIMTYKAFISQVSDEFQAKVAEGVNAAVKEGKKFDMEFSLIRSNDDQLRWVRAAGNLTHNIDGAPAYFTGLLHDVTENKKDDIRKNDFIAMVSHELKTPITSLQAYIQMLSVKAKKADDTFTFDSLSKANAQVKKMVTMINGFLNISSLESGKIDLNKRNFEIGDLIKEAVEEVTITTSRKNIAISLCSSLIVNADRDKIAQVINNLLTNAVKYSAKNDHIQVACKVVDERLQISVQDEGIGVKPEDQKKLFDRYYRVQGMESQTVSGFGIGLYLCEEIIQRHKGKIWLESEAGKGSTFYFDLPLV